MRHGKVLSALAERSQSVSVFRHACVRAPDAIAGQIDGLPAERGEMGARITHKPVRKTPPTQFPYVVAFRQGFSYIFWPKNSPFRGSPGR
jgi:hypothetical protein